MRGRDEDRAVERAHVEPRPEKPAVAIGYRGVFDAGLSVSMTQRLSLTAGLTYRYDSDPGEGLERLDTLFVTGIALKMD